MLVVHSCLLDLQGTFFLHSLEAPEFHAALPSGLRWRRWCLAPRPSLDAPREQKCGHCPVCSRGRVSLWVLSSQSLSPGPLIPGASDQRAGRSSPPLRSGRGAKGGQGGPGGAQNSHMGSGRHCPRRPDEGPGRSLAGAWPELGHCARLPRPQGLVGVAAALRAPPM